MPKGTRVHRCVSHIKAKGGGNPYAICQAATHQSYATGKPLGGKRGGKKMAELPRFNLEEKPQQEQTFELCGMSRGKGMKHRHYRMAGNSCSKRNHFRVMAEPSAGGVSIPDQF